MAIIGKTMGPWTLAYHVFGVERFLLMSVGRSRHDHAVPAQTEGNFGAVWGSADRGRGRCADFSRSRYRRSGQRRILRALPPRPPPGDGGVPQGAAHPAHLRQHPGPDGSTSPAPAWPPSTSIPRTTRSRQWTSSTAALPSLATSTIRKRCTPAGRRRCAGRSTAAWMPG